MSGGIINRYYGLKPDENEIGLLAIHFGAALERQGLMHREPIKNVLIVCASGMATALLLEEKVKRYFGDSLKVDRDFIRDLKSQMEKQERNHL